jgi:rhodanese-related sulfurtransferase
MIRLHFLLSFIFHHNTFSSKLYFQMYIGGGRGQKACEYLISQGYTNVINGGGPLDEDCWGIYGDL